MAVATSTLHSSKEALHTLLPFVAARRYFAVLVIVAIFSAIGAMLVIVALFSATGNPLVAAEITIATSLPTERATASTTVSANSMEIARLEELQTALTYELGEIQAKVAKLHHAGATSVMDPTESHQDVQNLAKWQQLNWNMTRSIVGSPDTAAMQNLGKDVAQTELTRCESQQLCSNSVEFIAHKHQSRKGGLDIVRQEFERRLSTATHIIHLFIAANTAIKDGLTKDETLQRMQEIFLNGHQYLSRVRIGRFIKNFYMEQSLWSLQERLLRNPNKIDIDIPT